MIRPVLRAMIALALLALAPVTAGAAERTVALGVRMYCPSCAYTVKRMLMSVAGVKEVDVSLADRRAVVVYDDSITGVSDLVAATKKYGYDASVLANTGVSPRDSGAFGATTRREAGAKETLSGFLRRLLSGLDEPKRTTP